MLTATIALEHVAFEAGKDVAQLLASQREFDVWLRRVAVWLARHLGRQTVLEISRAIGRTEVTAWVDARRAEILQGSDPEFARMTRVIGDALVAL